MNTSGTLVEIICFKKKSRRNTECNFSEAFLFERKAVLLSFSSQFFTLENFTTITMASFFDGYLRRMKKSFFVHRRGTQADSLGTFIENHPKIQKRIICKHMSKTAFACSASLKRYNRVLTRFNGELLEKEQLFNNFKTIAAVTSKIKPKVSTLRATVAKK